MTVFTANAALKPGVRASKVFLTLPIKQNKPKLPHLFQSTCMILLQENVYLSLFCIQDPVPRRVTAECQDLLPGLGWRRRVPRPGNRRPLDSPAALATPLHFNVDKVLGTLQGLLSTPRPHINIVISVSW